MRPACTTRESAGGERIQAVILVGVDRKKDDVIGILEACFHFFVEVALVVFERQGKIALLLDNLIRNLRLSPHGINSDNTASQR